MQNKTSHHPRFSVIRIAFVFCLLALPVLTGCPRGKPDIEKTGGTTIIVQIDPVPADAKESADIILTLKKRFAKAKFPGAFFTDTGNGKIQIDLPGMVGEKVKRARKIIEPSGHLELRKINLDGFRPQPDGRTLAEHVLAGDAGAPGFKAVVHEFTDPDGNPESEVLLLARKAALDNGDIKHGRPNGFDPSKVDITLTSDGEDKMIALTKDMAPGRDRIAIVLDGKVMSAPVVISVPLGRQFVIEGLDGPGEAENLAAALISPLKCQLNIVEERTVPLEIARDAPAGK